MKEELRMEQEIERVNHLLFLQKEEELQLVKISEMDIHSQTDSFIYFIHNETHGFIL